MKLNMHLSCFTYINLDYTIEIPYRSKKFSAHLAGKRGSFSR